MRNRFDQQLHHLDEQLTHMGKLCEIAISKVTQALKEGSAGQARIVVAEDEEIDQMEKEIERLCLKLLLQQQPVAKDLRRISAALKMITDMERIGDQTSDIAEIIISAGMSEARDISVIGTMAEATSKMVHDSILAYVNKDLEMAQKVMLADEEVDRMFELVKAKLVELILKDGGKQGEKAIDLIMITKYLERIGDHATNIAEWVEFSITGVHKDGQLVER